MLEYNNVVAFPKLTHALGRHPQANVSLSTKFDHVKTLNLRHTRHSIRI